VAVIERHPDVKDHFLELSLPDIKARGGIKDLFEEGHLIIIRDFRLDFDFEALAALSRSIDSVEDHELRRKLKKMTAPYFFKGKPPIRSGDKLLFLEPVRQAIYDFLCRGERETFERAARALKASHEEAKRIFDICFPGYEAIRFVPSVRLTRTLFENLHWDNHSIDDDFHQARIFANLDTRPRIWSIGDNFIDWISRHYREHDLGRFAGKDPNLMIDYITGSDLGGTQKTWMDNEARHRVAFDPGEVWLGESRLLSHQIYYGEAAMVYMWFVSISSMADPARRFNAQVEAVHRQMQGKSAS
jgi:hypothetical protein